MKLWPINSLRKGILTTKFPMGKNETISPWSTLPVRRNDSEPYCPVNAINMGKVSLEKCISCGRCMESMEPSLRPDNFEKFREKPLLKRSFKIFPIDSGTCGACNTELFSIGNPYYDATRLGIFFVNTPKQADALAIMGVYGEEMESVIKKAVEVMAQPAVIILFGACALSGGIIGRGLRDLVDPDLIIGGCPPDPFVILNALEKVRGR